MSAISRPSDEELSRLEHRIRDSQARSYDAIYAATYTPSLTDIQFNVLRRILAIGPEDVLLDLGCGTGRLSLRFAPLCRRVIAVDRSLESLKLLRERLDSTPARNVEYVQSDVTDPLGLNLANKAICVEVLQHIPGRKWRVAALKNTMDALSPGGKAAFVNETYGVVSRLRGEPREVTAPERTFLHLYSVGEIKRDLVAGGFKRIEVTACDALYWTSRRLKSRTSAKLDPILSRLPGIRYISRFLVAVGEKGRPTPRVEDLHEQAEAAHP